MSTQRTVDELRAYDKNPRKMRRDDFEMLQKSLEEFGDLSGVIFNRRTGNLVGGHQRTNHFRSKKAEITLTEEFEAPSKAGTVATGFVVVDGEKYAYREVDWDEEQEARANILANKVSADWDYDILANAFSSETLMESGWTSDELTFMPDFSGESETADGETTAGVTLSDRFLVPPFSVLNARDGRWQERKKQWIKLGIKSELGRSEEIAEGSDQKKARKKETGGLLMKSWTSHPVFYQQKTAKEKELGRKLTTAEFLEDYFVIPDDSLASGTSIFDPMLTEVCYTWFVPKGGVILDPFAGGSVRGIVANKLGYSYHGVELSKPQVEENRIQAQEIIPEHPPTWHAGDSMNIQEYCKGLEADFLFTCPPYADLEVYSTDPSDLSTMEYPKFREAYFEIIKRSATLLKEDRFAAIVVGDVRDKKGHYYDFVGDTVQAFRDAGLEYYNEAILVTTVGSLAIRVGRQFQAGRKLGKSHQNILVFVKGDWKKAAKACGDVSVYIPEDEQHNSETDESA